MLRPVYWSLRKHRLFVERNRNYLPDKSRSVCLYGDSSQIVKDFKKIAVHKYLIPIMEDENQANTPLNKEA